MTIFDDEVSYGPPRPHVKGLVIPPASPLIQPRLTDCKSRGTLGRGIRAPAIFLSLRRIAFTASEMGGPVIASNGAGPFFKTTPPTD